jgi:TRAP transporter TAXI family solute receptor
LIKARIITSKPAGATEYTRDQYEYDLRRAVESEGVTGMISIRLPLWLRAVLLTAVVIVGTGASLIAYRYYTRPVTLTVAAGSIDGEAAKVMSAIASRLASTNAAVRLKVIDSGTTPEAAKAFSEGTVDLALVRGDVGDLSQAQAIVVVSHVVALMIAPPGSTIDSMDKLKGRHVGVVGGSANNRIIDVLSKEYGLDRAKIFKEIALPDVRRAIQTKEVDALFVVIPLAERYLSQVRGFFAQGSKALPTLISIDAADAIAESNRAYESFDVPKGTLRGAPPIPDDDVTTLRTSLYLVARKQLSSDLMATFTQAIMSVRRDLLAEQPIFAQITAPSTDPDAYLPVHPGAAEFYNGTQQSFLDEYSNWIYLTPMILGGAASVLAAAWQFLGVGQPTPPEGPLDSLYALARRIRKIGTESELSDIEEEIDRIIGEQRRRSASGEGNAVDDATLTAAAHRLEDLIHDRRILLATKPPITTAA